MFDENVNSLCALYTHRGFNNIVISHYPTEEEPFLTISNARFSCCQYFGKPLTNTLDIDVSGVEGNLISAEKVKVLREKYGYGIMDCKKALQKANGDMKLAYNILRGLK
ncbi:MAG: hypothetical protein EOM67_08725 [Spirochaetia bacterium]|nr:hypothetical protein [Spirochaetia bacterium]